jgi:hypothetical protein
VKGGYDGRVLREMGRIIFGRGSIFLEGRRVFLWHIFLWDIVWFEQFGFWVFG